MFYRLVKRTTLGAIMEETVFQSAEWAVTAVYFYKWLSDKFLVEKNGCLEPIALEDFEKILQEGFVWNSWRYRLETFDHPDQAHTIEGFVNGESYGEMSWGTWYNLAYYNRDGVVRAFIGKVDVTPDASDPTGETWG